MYELFTLGLQLAACHVPDSRLFHYGDGLVHGQAKANTNTQNSIGLMLQLSS
ncbi:hypothetical protein COLO4_17420 [Corchorus olitorius]|uniref:Uncharacterized protein n=1 Tax=Corchorus olitorius TaxID=93759 RepID=A0A1R3JCS6_9ROSI|nr:hypothetical protein COLO4_17420 [Corchorus olitorius]